MAVLSHRACPPCAYRALCHDASSLVVAEPPPNNSQRRHLAPSRFRRRDVECRVGFGVSTRRVGMGSTHASGPNSSPAAGGDVGCVRCAFDTLLGAVSADDPADRRTSSVGPPTPGCAALSLTAVSRSGSSGGPHDLRPRSGCAPCHRRCGRFRIPCAFECLAADPSLLVRAVVAANPATPAAALETSLRRPQRIGRTGSDPQPVDAHNISAPDVHPAFRRHRRVGVVRCSAARSAHTEHPQVGQPVFAQTAQRCLTQPLWRG